MKLPWVLSPAPKDTLREIFERNQKALKYVVTRIQEIEREQMRTTGIVPNITRILDGKEPIE